MRSSYMLFSPRLRFSRAFSRSRFRSCSISFAVRHRCPGAILNLGRTGHARSARVSTSVRNDLADLAHLLDLADIADLAHLLDLAAAAH